MKDAIKILSLLFLQSGVIFAQTNPIAETEGELRISSNTPTMTFFDNRSNENRIELRIREEDDNIIFDNFTGDLNIRNDIFNLQNSAGRTLVRSRFHNNAGNYSGEIELFGTTNRTIKIDAQSSNTSPTTGSAITMYDHLAHESLKLISKGVEEGAVIDLFDIENGAGTRVLRLASGENDGSVAGHGIASFYNEHGIRTIKIDGQAGFGDHAHITMWDGSSSSSSIQINSNFGGTGNSRIVTDVLQIAGGSDLCEGFDISGEEKISPGMLVSIDPHGKGTLQITNEKYDKKFAGIVSGANGINPGMIMNQEASIASGNQSIALAGRVYVYASTEGGTIQPGDLLTSSSTPGYAMKSNHAKKSQGAIIGKAMTTIDENGFVLVLVNLQ